LRPRHGWGVREWSAGQAATRRVGMERVTWRARKELRQKRPSAGEYSVLSVLLPSRFCGPEKDRGARSMAYRGRSPAIRHGIARAMRVPACAPSRFGLRQCDGLRPKLLAVYDENEQTQSWTVKSCSPPLRCGICAVAAAGRKGLQGDWQPCNTTGSSSASCSSAFPDADEISTLPTKRALKKPPWPWIVYLAIAKTPRQSNAADVRAAINGLFQHSDIPLTNADHSRLLSSHPDMLLILPSP